MSDKQTTNVTKPTESNNEAPLSQTPTTNTQEKPARARSIEILDTAAPATMTRNEAMKYIKYLREENERLVTKIRALEDNTKSAFAKAEYVTKTTNTIEDVYINQLNYIVSNIDNIKTAIENSMHVAIARVTNIKKGI